MRQRLALVSSQRDSTRTAQPPRNMFTVDHKERHALEVEQAIGISLLTHNGASQELGRTLASIPHRDGDKQAVSPSKRAPDAENPKP